MKAQKAKMKDNEGPKGQNELKKAEKAKNWKMQPDLALLNSFMWDIKKTSHFW